MATLSVGALAASTALAFGSAGGARSHQRVALCGAERWAVKTLQDRPRLLPVHTASIAYLVSRPAPLDGEAGFEAVAALADAVGRRLVERHPRQLTLEFLKADRGGRIFVDIGRNAYVICTAARRSPLTGSLAGAENLRAADAVVGVGRRWKAHWG